MRSYLFVNESYAVYSVKEFNTLVKRLEKNNYKYIQSGINREYYRNNLNSNIFENVKRGF